MTRAPALRPRLLALAAAAASAAALAAPAQAQLSSEGGPIAVNAGNVNIFETRREVRYTGGVDVVQGDARLTADAVTVFFAPGGQGGGVAAGFGQVSRITAQGDVFYVTPDLKTRGDAGQYDASADTITLQGNVILVRCGDVAEGNVLIVQVGEGQTRLDGGQGRVRMVLNPGTSQGGGPGCPA